jgi:ATP-dependent helicase YprA (DUF1998 family)
MNCEEKTRLASEYEAATVRFSSAVTELRTRMGTCPKEEYERLDRAANEARVKSEQARLALEQHIAATVASISERVSFETSAGGPEIKVLRVS